MTFDDEIRCPKCWKEENIYWHGEDTSKCHNCGHVGIDIDFCVKKEKK